MRVPPVGLDPPVMWCRATKIEPFVKQKAKTEVKSGQGDRGWINLSNGFVANAINVPCTSSLEIRARFG